MTTETRRTTDLWVTTRNELGALSKLTTWLKNENINIESIVCWEEGDNAQFRMMTSDNTKAREVWTREGYQVQETPVVLWNTTNAPGRINVASTALAEANVNTNCAYATTSPDGKSTTVLFYTDNPERTSEVLSNLR